MNKKEITNLELTVYSEKLSNGLEVYIIPKDNVNTAYATYTTRYGGMHNDFALNNGEMISVPKGIAHFLEHKMFEQEDGSDAFKFFSERGTDANANTNPRKTTYLFAGPNAFYENIEFLLSYVETPYFTDENVEKEKGIIEQEIKMYEDKPASKLFLGLLYNSLIEHPMKYPTIGTVESVYSITKEDLYNCYNTFYHPSNMFLVITGNVDPEKTLEIIKKHEEKRNVGKSNTIKIKEYNEPRNVDKKEETIKMDVTIPKTAIAYKVYVGNIDVPMKDIYTVLLNSIDIKLGVTSLFNERLRESGLITTEVGVSGIRLEDYILVIIDAETKYPKEVINEIKKELESLDANEEDFERRKKCGISNLVMTSDNIFRTNNYIVNNLIYENEIDYDPIGSIRKIDMELTNKVLKKINLDNYTIFNVNPLNK